MTDKSKRIHVGCGPQNLLNDWTNVDIRPFKGVDRVMDVTQEWPFDGVEYVFGEHFIEHLALEDALAFLVNAGNSMIEGGVLRLTTPNLEWVIKTHYRPGAPLQDTEALNQVLRINRAFHGWGHQFLWDRHFLSKTLEKLNFASHEFLSYGESSHPQLQNLERHGGFSMHGDTPNLLVVEATRGKGRLSVDPEHLTRLKEEFIRHVASGH